MNRSYRPYIKRIMVLVTALMLMLLLCGCRTRITNNTEVGNSISDESGMMSEDYQVRRDELGIPVAEAPLFNGSESDEEDSEDYEDYDSEEDYDEEYDEDIDEEEYEDDEDVDDTSTTRTPVSRPSNPVIRHPVTTPQSTSVTVKLDLNAKDAKCNLKSITVRKDYSYGALPTPTRTDYTFEGWYTAKSKGNKVTSTTKVTTSKAHTLYAHWKKIVKKKYTITFDGNSEDDEVTLSSTEKTVEEGGVYGDLPTAKREKHTFKGWFTDPSKGSQITKKTKFTANKNQTLYAQWEYEPYKWWKGKFEVAANEIDSASEISYLIDENSEGDNDKADSLLKSCRVRKAEEDTQAEIVIKFVKKYDEDSAVTDAEAVYEKYSETSPDTKVVIVSTDALYGSKEEKLLYMMTLLSNIYGGGYDLNEAEYDLHDGDSVSCYFFGF